MCAPTIEFDDCAALMSFVKNLTKILKFSFHLFKQNNSRVPQTKLVPSPECERLELCYALKRVNCCSALSTDICTALLHLQPGERVAKLTAMIKLRVVPLIAKVNSILAFHCAESARSYHGLIFTSSLKNAAHRRTE